ncbi:hypothetical protein M106_2374 [Bacteroides fragilis str. 1009-4-F |nr:hypothetical protein M106_2374 [Bacteroides fragilis str. 1009-4-F \
MLLLSRLWLCAVTNRFHPGLRLLCLLCGENIISNRFKLTLKLFFILVCFIFA